jgi:hypothetical protein
MSRSDENSGEIFRSFRVPLGGDRQVDIWFPADVTARDLDVVIRDLQTLKRISDVVKRVLPVNIKGPDGEPIPADRIDRLDDLVVVGRAPKRE